MGQLKSHEVDTWLAAARPGTPVVLIYGPDRGLVSERARRFATLTGLALDDPFSVIKLDAAELERDPGRLLDEANTVSMFAGRRLLWIRNAGAQKALADAVKLLCKAPPADCSILVEAGDLKKTAPLRSVIEASAAGLALPCYADDARGIDAVIDDELGKADLRIEPDARALLQRSLGGDRLASRAEIGKLVLYAMGAGRITLDDVMATTGDVSAISMDDAVDAVLSGDVARFDESFSRQASGGSQAYLVLAAATRQLQGLHAMRGAMERNRRSAASLVAAARPPVFYLRRKLVEQALERWDSAGLGRALARLQDAVLQSRRRPEIAVAVARHALLGIAVESARRSKNRAA